MQRRMLYVCLAVFGLILLLGGAYFARKQYYASKPAPIWVPLALRADISMEDQGKLAKEIETKLRNDDLLKQVVVDANLQSKLGVASEDEAVEELKQRLFVKSGTAETANGSVPSVNIGFNGKWGEREATGDAATRIMRDVWKMVGIDPDTGEKIEAGLPQ